MWDRNAEIAFVSLKDALTKHPVLLSFPSWQCDMYLQTDASSVAVRAVLSQKESGEIEAIGLLFIRPDASQRHYSGGKLECWALIAAARKWRGYLQGARRVVFLCDHKPLCWLRKQRPAGICSRGGYMNWRQLYMRSTM